MSDDTFDFDYENRQEHKILWPPPPTCPYCGREGDQHKQVECGTCGERICPPDSIQYRIYRFCCEECRDTFIQKINKES